MAVACVVAAVFAWMLIFLTSGVPSVESTITNTSVHHTNHCTVSEFLATRIANVYFICVATLGLFVALVGFVCNGIVVLTFAKTKSLQMPSNVFLVNLAIGDMFFCSFGYTAQVMLDFLPHLVCDSKYMFVKTFFIKMSIFQSIVNVSAIAVERFVAIDFPFQYQAHVTSERLIIMVISSWCITAVLAASTTYVQLNIGKHYLDVSIVGILCITIVIIYSRVYLVSRRHIMRDRAHGIINKKSKSQAAVIIAMVFMISWIPSVILRLFAVSDTAKTYMNQFTYLGPLVGTWFNILVFTYRMTHFRRAVSGVIFRHSLSRIDSLPSLT